MHARVTEGIGKGWFVGPWNSIVPVAIGYADTGVNDPHLHEQMCEVYLVARGTSTMHVGDETLALTAADMVVVEPGEPHTFTGSSDDYLHFVVQAPFVHGDKRGL
jgi:mannose-6-phosphate isomerase-like protein (cupin superfamily)